MKRFIRIAMFVFLIASFSGVSAYAFYAPTGFESSPPPAGFESSLPPQGLSLPTSDIVPDNFQRLYFRQLAEQNTGHLMLVNNYFAVPEEIPAELVRIIDHVRTLNNNQNILLDREALENLREMMASATRFGFARFMVTEGYRTHARQFELYNSEQWGPLSARPGHSEHQVGLAVDISYPGVNIGNSRQGTWLMENSYRYGFVLSFPAHKTHITGFPFEPWHYRFVGQPHAYFMHTNDLVLVEYIEFLRERREIAVNFDGTEYRVFYMSATQTFIDIPVGYFYNASLDNTGGIIITAWR